MKDLEKRLAAVWDAFKANSPKKATILAAVLILAITLLEYAMTLGWVGPNFGRIMELLLIVRIALGGSRTYDQLNEETLDPLSIMPTVQDNEVEIFKYVKPDAVPKYEEILNKKSFTIMSLPPADIVISRMESVVFDPQDVTLSEANWMISTFGDKSDYEDFKKADNGQKFYIYHFDTGIKNTLEDVKTAVVDRYDFTGFGLGDKQGHGTFSVSMYGSTNPKHSAFPEKVRSRQIQVADMKVLGDNGSGDFNHIIKAVDFMTLDAKKKQARGYITMANMSLGADAPTPKNLSDSLKAAREAGILILAATGNSGLNKIGTPSNDPNVVAITATTPKLKRANFGNIGDGVIFAEGGVMCYGLNLNGINGFSNGTSFSTPWAQNLFIAAGSLYKFSGVDEMLEYVQGVVQDIGDIGYDTTFGYGYGVLRWMLDNPPINKEKVILDDVNLVKKKQYTLSSKINFDVAWSVPGQDGDSVFFLTRIKVRYSGHLTPRGASVEVLGGINRVLSEYRFEASSKLDYTDVARMILMFIEEYLKSKNLDVEIVYAELDDDKNHSDTLELDYKTISGKRNYSIFDPKSWSIKNKKSLETLLQAYKNK